MITSSGNAKIKQIVQWQNKARARREDDIFLVEGLKMFEEAPQDRILEVYISKTLEEKLMKPNNSALDETVLAKLKAVGYEVIADDIFRKISDTQTPQGILSVIKRQEYNFDLLLKEKCPLLLVVENLQDPGNLGTMVRTGEGAGITGVIMSSQTVDIYNAKTIRATMGSIYRVPFLYVEDMKEAIRKIKEIGIHTYAAHLDGRVFYQELSLGEPTAFLIGNEGNGLTKEIADMADSYIKIPMEGQVESLNAAIAAALLVYEAKRQRS